MIFALFHWLEIRSVNFSISYWLTHRVCRDSSDVECPNLHSVGELYLIICGNENASSIYLFVFVLQVSCVVQVKGNEDMFISQCLTDRQRQTDSMRSDCMALERVYRELEEHTRTISFFFSIISNCQDPGRRDCEKKTPERILMCFFSILAENQLSLSPSEKGLIVCRREFDSAREREFDSV